MLDIDLTLARGFSVAETELPPSGEAIRYVPPVASGAGRDGPLLEVVTDAGARWTAMFADSQYGPAAVANRVVALPDGESFVVLAGGSAYVVTAADPDSASELRCFPVTSFAVADRVVVLGSFSQLCALHGIEPAWTSQDLVLDELEILGVTDGRIRVRGYEPRSGSVDYMTFAVDLATGQPDFSAFE